MVLQCYTWILNLFQQMFGDDYGGDDVLYSVERNIPDDIIFYILSRLPAKSIFQCRKVCKNWLMMISSYEFIEMQQRMAPPVIIRYSSWYLPDFYIIDGKSEKKYRANCQEKYVDFVSCCNGLMLLRTGGSNLKYFVLNPLLPARITTIGVDVIWHGIFCGFFFHPLAKEYRILSVCRKETLYDYHMYLFGSKKWRRTACPSFIGRPLIHKARAIVNGALHWCGLIKLSQVINEYWYGILIFDIVTEEFSMRPYPQHLCQGRMAVLDLLVEEDRLCLCTRAFGDLAMNIWILEDYAKWLWVQKYKVNLDWDVKKYPMEIADCEPLACQIKVLSIHNDELRLFWKYRGVFCCQIGSNMVKKIDVKKLVGHHNPYKYDVSSYVSYTKSLVILPD